MAHGLPEYSDEESLGADPEAQAHRISRPSPRPAIAVPKIPIRSVSIRTDSRAIA